MTNTIKYPLLIALSAILALTGCLEHRYQFSVLTDQSVSVHYELRGDRVDIEDGNELLPDSAIWSIERSVEESEEETAHIIKGTRSIKSFQELSKILDWKKGIQDSIYFQPQVSMTSRTVFFGKRWDFSAILPSRKFNETYGDIWDYVPEECRAIENEDELKNLPSDEVKMLEKKFGLGVIQWNRARYERAFDYVWQVCNANNLLLPDENQTGLSVAKAGWIDDLHIYLNSLDVGEPQTANLNWWTDVKPQFVERFSNLIDTSIITRMVAIADAAENNYLISKDLEDDKFLFELSLPGLVSTENGEIEDNLVKWEFSGKDISNDEITMIASTFQFDYLQISGAVALLFAAFFLIMKRKSNPFKGDN